MGKKKKKKELEKKKKKEKLRRKRKKRLTRFLLLCGVAFLVVVLAQILVGKGGDQAGTAKIIHQSLGKKIGGFGESILGEAVKHLPSAPDLEEVDKIEVEKIDPETEPIKEPAENVRQQTETLLETIKNLPQDQVEAIKRQIYKDFCQDLIEEEE